MNIDYDHSRNSHGVTSPALVLPLLLELAPIRSIVDVGCGTGVWLQTARRLGVEHVLGLDGVRLPESRFLLEPACFRQQDFTQPWHLDRRYDLCLCLEVAEHLPAESAPALVRNLCAAADLVAFSAAIPHQSGQHHVNCRWPAYWQEHFNREGFACEDTLRPRIWDRADIEPWYRQNLFIARRAPTAGKEPRLAALIHPDIGDGMLLEHEAAGRREGYEAGRRDILAGNLRAVDYVTLAGRVLASRVRDKLTGRR